LADRPFDHARAIEAGEIELTADQALALSDAAVAGPQPASGGGRNPQ
jgi:hypothetical protein